PQIPETAQSFLAARSELAPAFFPDVDSIMRPRRLDIREGEFAIGVGDAIDLIEAGKRVSHMARICERLLALPGKGVDAFRQIAACGQIAVLRVGLPSGLCGHLLLLHCPFVVFAQLLSSPRFFETLSAFASPRRLVREDGSHLARPRRARWQDRSDDPAPAPE